MVKNKEIDMLRFDGGLLCLDFVNSVHDRRSEPLNDLLFSIHDLTSWAKRIGIIDPKEEKQLDAHATRHPKKAEAFFREALTLRELLARIFRHISNDKKVAATDLAGYNQLLATYFPLLQVKQGQQGFSEEWNIEDDSFFKITAPILNDSYELLLSDKLSRIKECPNCGWLFRDVTKNGKRRWCSMKSCGSNVKALEWYHRQKEQ